MKRMKHYIHKKSMLVKLFLTVVGLLCIPLVGMQLMVVFQSTAQMRITNDEYYYNLLQTNAQTLNSRIDFLSRMATRLSVDETISKPLGRNATGYATYSAAKHIYDIEQTIPFDCSIGVFYYDGNYVLSETYQYRLDFYLNKISENSDACAQALNEHLMTTDNVSFFSTEEYLSNGYFFITKPVPITSVNANDASIFFLLDLGELSDLFRTSLVNDVSFAILDGDGCYILRDEFFEDTFVSKKPFQNLIDIEGEGKIGIDSDNSSTIYKWTDETTGWTYLMSVEKSAVEQKLADYIANVKNLIILTLFLAFAMIVLTVYINYRPIYQMLAKHVNQKADMTMSELELIDSTFFALDEKIANQKDLLVNFTLSDLLSGTKVDKEIITQHLPVHQYSAFSVAVLDCPKLSPEQETAITNEIETQAEIDHIVVTGVADHPETILVCMAKASINTAILKESLLLAAQHQIPNGCKVNVGFPVSTIDEIRLSFLDALTADIAATSDENIRIQTMFPAEDVQTFVKAVYFGDEQKALHALHKVETVFYKDIVGTRVEHYFNYKLLSAYVTAIKDHGSALTQEEIKELLDVDNSQQTFSNLRKSLGVYCYRITALEEKASKQIQQKLIQYVNDHYLESDICLNSAADFLNTSIYTVSKLFKEATNQGFKEYITNKRLDFASKILVNDNDSVVEVAQKAGFENAAYFSAVFKSRFGMPPSKYRKINRE